MDRFWGEDKDKIAAKQLGISEDYTIFMMANEMEYWEDLREVRREFDGYASVDEVCEELYKMAKTVLLPGRLQLVGMMPLNEKRGKEIFGVVDFSGEY